MNPKCILPVRLALLLTLVLSLAGCGVAQSVKNGSASAARTIFYPKVETLHLQLVARAALNSDQAQMSSPVEIRIWPLRNTSAFSQASYSALLKQDGAILATSISGRPVITRVLPGNTTSVDIPLADDVQAVSVAAFFLYPDMQRDNWRLIISREDMDASNPTIIELINSELRVRE